MDNKSLKIFSWNVNSINARLENIIKLIEVYNPDVLLLQEIKAEEHKVPQTILEDLGYNIKISGQKSYNGVAILSKYRVEEVIIKEFEGAPNEARYIEGLINVNSKCVRIASVYVPNGQAVISEKFSSKLSFLYDLNQYLRAIKNDEMFFIGGDFNVAQDAIDLFDPVKSKNHLGFHDRERELIDKIIDGGFKDTLRQLHPTQQIFSWWDYRDRNSFKSNRGWRIDYILSSPSCERVIVAAGVAIETREWVRPSDHAPVFCEVAL